MGRAQNRKKQRREQARLGGVPPRATAPILSASPHNPDLPPEVMKMLRKIARPEYLDESGKLVGRPPVSALFNGWRYVAIGARMVKVPPQTTFHEFLEMLLLSDVLGNEWIAAERERPEVSQHPIARWLFELRDLRGQAPAEASGSVRTLDMTGSALAFLTLGYDVYSILHCGALPAQILARLKHPTEFQGAKYEIAVAGLFARAGFTIEWIDDPARKRPEFIAAHKTTGEKLVVEAKSRHRAGVLGRPGAAEIGEMKAGLDRLLRAALEKETDDVPYAIYLDANLPLSNDPARGLAWLPDVQRMLDTRAPSASSPDPFSAITVTNFSWHYTGNTTTAARSESLLVLSRHPHSPLRDERTIRLIYTAAQQYGDVPGTFPED